MKKPEQKEADDIEISALGKITVVRREECAGPFFFSSTFHFFYGYRFSTC
jgi:hypothetical protein